MLCQLCKEFLRQLNPLREGWREFESQRIWKCGEAAVAQDCKFCRYTQKILQEPIEVFLKENPDAKKDGEAHLEIELRYSVTHNASRPTPINVELRAEKDGAWIKSMFFDLQKVDSNQGTANCASQGFAKYGANSGGKQSYYGTPPATKSRRIQTLRLALRLLAGG